MMRLPDTAQYISCSKMGVVSTLKDIALVWLEITHKRALSMPLVFIYTTKTGQECIPLDQDPGLPLDKCTVSSPTLCLHGVV
jgi:hypothetical protein